MYKHLFAVLGFLLLLPPGESRAQTTESSVRTTIGSNYNDSFFNRITPSKERATLSSIIDYAAQRTPYLTIGQLRAGKADTAQVVHVVSNERVWVYRYAPGNTSSDDGFAVINASGRRYLLSADYTTPELYGAKGDSVTDDTQAMILALGSGGHLHLNKNKRYRIQAGVVLSNNVIHGNGAKIIITQTNQNIVVQDNSSIYGVVFRGNGISDANFHENGILKIQGNNINISGCHFSRYASYGIRIASSSSVRIINNTFIDAIDYLSGNSDSDILIYGGAGNANSNILVEGNFTLSKEKNQGIWVNGLGYDKNITVVNNISGAYNNNYTLASQGSVTKRHGIQSSYGNTFLGGGILIAGNQVINCRVTGIYVASNAAGGTTTVEGNFVEKCGWSSSEVGLVGGIRINSGSNGDVVRGNTVVDFLNTNINTGAIFVSFDATNAVQTKVKSVISDNVVRNSKSAGILLQLAVRNIDVFDNYIDSTAYHNINVVGGLYTGANVNRNIVISRNTLVRRDTLNSAIFVDNANVSTTLGVLISENNITGKSKTSSAENAGINIRFPGHPFTIKNNHIKNIRFGIYLSTQIASGVKKSDGFIIDNQIDSTSFAYVIRGGNGHSTLFVEGAFGVGNDNLTGGNGYASAGRLVESVSSTGNTVGYAATAPTGGVYMVGDVRYSTTPAPGGFVGWVCTSAGTPGTWKTFGVISN